MCRVKVIPGKRVSVWCSGPVQHGPGWTCGTEWEILKGELLVGRGLDGKVVAIKTEVDEWTAALDGWWQPEIVKEAVLEGDLEQRAKELLEKPASEIDPDEVISLVEEAIKSKS